MFSLVFTHTVHSKTFLHTYEMDIVPKLQEIDIFLKADIEKLNISSTSKLLHISEEEVKAIMLREGIRDINIFTFFVIMKNGSSNICHLFRRELERGTPKRYTCEDIAYIYNIEINRVYEAFRNSGLSEITASTLKILFAHIPIPMYN